MKSFKWMIAGCCMLITILLLTIYFSTVKLNRLPVEKTTRQTISGQDIPEIVFPVHTIGVQPCLFY